MEYRIFTYNNINFNLDREDD